MSQTTRFNAIFPQEHVGNLEAFIFGNGAIGSFTAEALCRMGIAKFHLFDYDSVEIENIGVSAYDTRHLGRNKSRSLAIKIREINEHADVRIYVDEIDETTARLIPFDTENSLPVLAFDNMEARLLVARTAIKAGTPYLIDARMGAETFQLYTLANPTIDEYEQIWYSDEEGDDEPCNAKATPYCASMAGAFIANSVRKLVTKQPFNERILFNFPSMLLTASNLQ
jgi:molybdopterin/thiamine biosynthesis adenylyltransferase|tara:strand:+ start:3901 stop:4575 length:675 start_codon:yes stop_codon:yes gene_type:complete